MNRSLPNVILGGFGTNSTGTGKAMLVVNQVTPTSEIQLTDGYFCFEGKSQELILKSMLTNQ